MDISCKIIHDILSSATNIYKLDFPLLYFVAEINYESFEKAQTNGNVSIMIAEPSLINYNKLGQTDNLAIIHYVNCNKNIPGRLHISDHLHVNIWFWSHPENTFIFKMENAHDINCISLAIQMDTRHVKYLSQLLQQDKIRLIQFARDNATLSDLDFAFAAIYLKNLSTLIWIYNSMCDIRLINLITSIYGSDKYEIYLCAKNLCDSTCYICK
jgi:hypothetical protein